MFETNLLNILTDLKEGSSLDKQRTGQSTRLEMAFEVCLQL